jgi:hypothetical protein
MGIAVGNKFLENRISQTIEMAKIIDGHVGSR